MPNVKKFKVYNLNFEPEIIVIYAALITFAAFDTASANFHPHVSALWTLRPN